MAETILPYFLAGTALFFFWVYGIASFVLDVKHKFVPAATRYWHHRQTDSASDASEESSVADTDSMTSLWRQESDAEANYADQTHATTSKESTHNRENIDSDESLH
jgi:hypothetical protein